MSSLTRTKYWVKTGREVSEICSRRDTNKYPAIFFVFTPTSEAQETRRTLRVIYLHIEQLLLRDAAKDRRLPGG